MKREPPAIQMIPYLSFKGDCEAAFHFYTQSLGGQLGMLFRYAGSPMANQVPSDWQEKIMHGSITIGDRLLMGADLAPDHYQQPQGFSLSLQIKRAEDAGRVFRALGQGGKVLVPLEETFWAERFGMVIDRFGIPWSVNCERPDQ